MARATVASALVAALLAGCAGVSRPRDKGAINVDRFETERLIIRRFTPDDWAGIQELARDKESSEAAAWDHRWPTDEKGCKGAAGYFTKRDTCWAVCLKDGGRLIGFISFNDIDADKRLDLGHLFHREFTRQDHDTEALRCMVDHAFTHLGVEAVHGDNAEEWTAQLAPLKKLGMTRLEPPPESRGRKSSFRKRPDGTPIEFVACRMQITREEWLRRQGKAGPRPVYEVPLLERFVVDGDPAEWGDAGFRGRLIGVHEREQTLASRDDIAVSFRLGWTHDGLAVLLEVRDDECVEDHFDHRLGQGDHFALYVADSVEGRNMVKVLVAPGVAPDQPNLRYAVHDHRGKELRRLPAEATVARVKRPDGYTAEVLVPWTMLGITPERGRELGFQLSMRDWDKAGPNAHVVWFPCLRNWRPADNLHALRLSTTASPAFDQAAFAWVDYTNLARATYRVVCRRSDAGRAVSALSRGKAVAQAAARAEGEVAVADLEGTYPRVGSEDEVQEIQIDGQTVGAAFVRARSGRRVAAVLRRPAFARLAFSGETFPPCDIAQQPDVREWLGPCTVTVQHYDERCRPVDKAASPGRYGAVVTVTPENGEALRLYRTLRRTDGAAPAEPDPVSDSLWWEGLKREAGLPDEAILDGLAEWDEVGGEFAGQFYRSARVLTRCLEFLGDPARAVEIMSVSGASWRLLWHEGKWEPGICAMFHFGHLVEEHRVFGAIGREFLFLDKSGEGYSEDQMRAMVCREIDAGRPVIGCGVGDPAELAVVGYRQGGRVLVVAWGAKRESYKDVADWAKGEHFGGFLLIGPSKPAPAARDKVLAALKVAVSMARTPEANGRACGLAAYDAWARDLLRDECFPRADGDPLRRVAWSSGEAALALVDARAAAWKYLRDAQTHVGAKAREHLEAAAALHEKEWNAVMACHDHMPWGGEQGGHLVGITSRENREALAKAVLEARSHYAQAIEQIAKALEAEGVTP